MVDLALALGVRIRPEVEVPLFNAVPDLVELVLGDQERLMDSWYCGVWAEIHEVNAHTVAYFDDLEGTELRRLGETEHLGEEPGTSHGVV